jgi:UDP-N-acetylmuramoyl-L-alanyl-D-glutamate--2,6-diaminopimelate ligase
VQNVDYSFMEVSSHALVQGRVDLIQFRVAVFTNLTGDHLDYHKTMDEYFRAKSLLFRNLSRDAVAVINADDPYGQKLLDLTEARIFTYGLNSKSRIKAYHVQFDFTGSKMEIETPVGNFSLKTRLIGMHNVYNILAAVGAGLADGIPLDSIQKGIEQVPLIPGRLEYVDCGRDFYVFIDYAHTEDGLKNVLQALRLTGKAKIITVFGCGGDRDRTKRAKMGKVACELSDYSVVTTDNPRSESPEAIIREITAGYLRDNYEVVVDRTEAIYRALSMAESGDVVLIAGKGHETYQIFKDRTIDFDERKVIREFFKVV